MVKLEFITELGIDTTASQLHIKMALSIEQGKVPPDAMERLLEVSEHFSSF